MIASKPVRLLSLAIVALVVLVCVRGIVGGIGVGGDLLDNANRAAKAILNETRRQVTAELGVGHQATLRDKVWAEVRPHDRFEEQAVLVEPPPEDPYDELLELLDAALRDEAISGFDLWLLYELATEVT